MEIIQERIRVDTAGRGTYDVTAEINALTTSSRVDRGTVHIYCMHTSAGLILCENADPDVRTDLETFMSELVVDGDSRFIHTSEGPDDMPAHIRSILSGSDMTIPVSDGRLALGTWQGVYLWEHRSAPHRRTIVVTITGVRADR